MHRNRLQSVNSMFAMLVYVMSFVVWLHPKIDWVVSRHFLFPPTWRVEAWSLIAHWAPLCWYCFGRLSNPTQLSPLSMLPSSSIISSSLWPACFTTRQNCLNSSKLISPSWLTSTVLKNYLAEIFPKAPFQWFTASSLSIALLPSTSKMPKTCSTFALSSGDISYTQKHTRRERKYGQHGQPSSMVNLCTYHSCGLTRVLVSHYKLIRIIIVIDSDYTTHFDLNSA